MTLICSFDAPSLQSTFMSFKIGFSCFHGVDFHYCVLSFAVDNGRGTWRYFQFLTACLDKIVHLAILAQFSKDVPLKFSTNPVQRHYQTKLAPFQNLLL